MKTSSLWGAIFTLVLAGSTIVGCNYVSERYHPNYHAYRQQIRRVLVVAPEIGVFEELPDGATVWQMDKSREAERVIMKAVTEVLAAKDYTVQSAGIETSHNVEIRDVQTLFRAVNRSIQLHTYGPQIFPAKQAEFDYEVGPIDHVLDPYAADALVLVVGHQTVSSNRPKTWISIAVVEPGGKIIWYGMQGAKQNLDLQAHDRAFSLVHETLEPLMRVGS